jgi:hypothetical protein
MCSVCKRSTVRTSLLLLPFGTLVHILLVHFHVWSCHSGVTLLSDRCFALHFCALCASRPFFRYGYLIIRGHLFGVFSISTSFKATFIASFRSFWFNQIRFLVGRLAKILNNGYQNLHFDSFAVPSEECFWLSFPKRSSYHLILSFKSLGLKSIFPPTRLTNRFRMLGSI